jgi:hypothetical protein
MRVITTEGLQTLLVALVSGLVGSIVGVLLSAWRQSRLAALNILWDFRLKLREGQVVMWEGTNYSVLDACSEWLRVASTDSCDSSRRPVYAMA